MKDYFSCTQHTIRQLPAEKKMFYRCDVVQANGQVDEQTHTKLVLGVIRMAGVLC